eukprot:9898235-Alexandrium_andersonii.AAC.1
MPTSAGWGRSASGGPPRGRIPLPRGSGGWRPAPPAIQWPVSEPRRPDGPRRRTRWRPPSPRRPWRPWPSL